MKKLRANVVAEQVLILNKNICIMSFTYTFKFIIIGDSSVGKSCLLKKFIDGTFYNDFDTTIGVEFGAKIISCNNKNIKLQIWDTAGQETFRAITKSYYRGSCAIILVYDITQRSSFNNIPSWINDLKEININDQTVILIGNKTDLIESRQVEKEEGQQLAQNHGFLFKEISVKHKSNVGTVFNELAEQVLKKIETKQVTINDNGIKIGTSTIDLNAPNVRSRCCQN